MDDAVALKSIDIKLTWFDRVMGLVTVAIAFIAVRCLNFYQIYQLLQFLKRSDRREATLAEAEVLWSAVRKSSLLVLGRVACLEFSLAFVLFALTKGLSATWCVGAATDPIRAHAWVEVAGQPFHEMNNFDQHFKKLMTV